MKTKHTPGPWYYVNYADTLMLQDGPYYEDNNILSFNELFGVIDKDTAEANAKLAAAAPDLLEALIELRDIVLSEGYDVPDSTKQAIKKATE